MDMEGHGDNDKDTCGPNDTSEPKSDSSKRVKSDSTIGGTTQGLDDDLPDEHHKSKDVAAGDPKVSLVCWCRLPEVRKTTFGLYTTLGQQLTT